MKSFFLIGHPLGHSLSPVIHKALLELKNINAEYSLMDVTPEDLSSSFPALKNAAGFNVTIPHKINIIPMLDELDEKAQLFSAVNTVKCGEAIKGFNTDSLRLFAFAKNEGHRPFRQSAPLRRRRCFKNVCI